ncbi:MAG: T9SS type A sorting domain-containing protein [Ignavibacteriales bacterium]|nr:T9SS type A sorting domain-containing protein [Ignavibacteriales bacterium]
MKFFYTLFIVFTVTILTFSQAYVWELKQSGSSLGGPIDVEQYNSDNVYYGSGNKVYRSIDRGNTFQQMGNLIPGSSSVKSLTVNDNAPGTMVVAIEASPNDKIYKTTDYGQTWVLTNDEGQMSYFGIPVSQDPSHPDTLYTMVNTNFKRSTDFGSTWSTISSSFGPLNAPCDIEVFPDTSIILIGDNGTGIFKSTDYGLTWSQRYTTSGEIPTVSVDFTHPGVAWATKWSGGGGMLKSTDYGQTWNLVSYFGSINMWGVHIQPTDGNIILSNSYSTSPGSWRSTDAGTTWNPINIPSTGYQVFTVDSMTQFAAQGGGFYKLNSPFFIPVELTSFSASLINDNIVLKWTTATELNNSGFEIEKSNNNKDFEKIGFVPGYGTTTESKSYSYSTSKKDSKQYFRLKQVDFNGAFEYSSSVEVEGITPTIFSLKQNYPNPFNPTTKIGFTLPTESNVKISIYNLIGQKVDEIVNSKFSAGNHSVAFNADNLSSGIYLYKIEAGNFTSVKKMQLMK